jgi:hypothetical protein
MTQLVQVLLLLSQLGTSHRSLLREALRFLFLFFLALTLGLFAFFGGLGVRVLP